MLERVTGIEPALSAWELARHAQLTTVFAVQALFALPVSARYRLSQTVPSGMQRARRQVGGDKLGPTLLLLQQTYQAGGAVMPQPVGYHG